MHHIKAIHLILGVVSALAVLPENVQAAQERRHVRFSFLMLNGTATMTYSALLTEDALMAAPAPWHCVRRAVTSPVPGTYLGVVQCLAGTSGLSVEVSASCSTALDEKHHNVVTLKGEVDVPESTVIVHCLSETKGDDSDVDGF